MSVLDELLFEFSQVEEDILRTGEEFARDAAETVRIEAAKDGPIPGDIHIYATGNYRDSWTSRQIDRFNWSVENAAERRGREYAMYANEGYTRFGGAGSARSYLYRDPPGSYSNLTEIQLKVRLEDELQRRIDLLKEP